MRSVLGGHCHHLKRCLDDFGLRNVLIASKLGRLQPEMVNFHHAAEHSEGFKKCQNVSDISPILKLTRKCAHLKSTYLLLSGVFQRFHI